MALRCGFESKSCRIQHIVGQMKSDLVQIDTRIYRNRTKQIIDPCEQNERIFTGNLQGGIEPRENERIGEN